MKFKNPFRPRWVVQSGLVAKIDSSTFWHNLSNPWNLNLFDSKADAEDYNNFQAGKMNQHQAVTYLMSSKKLTASKAAQKLYNKAKHQEVFEINLIQFLANSHPLTFELSEELGELFGLDANYLFNLPAVNIYEEMDKRNQNQ